MKITNCFYYLDSEARIIKMVAKFKYYRITKLDTLLNEEGETDGINNCISKQEIKEVNT